MNSCKNCEEIFREIEGMKADIRSTRRRKKNRIRLSKNRAVQTSVTNDKRPVKKRKSPELIKSNDEKIQELLGECIRLLPDSHYQQVQRMSCNECGKILKNKHSLASHKSKFHKKIDEESKPELTECVQTETQAMQEK